MRQRGVFTVKCGETQAVCSMLVTQEHLFEEEEIVIFLVASTHNCFREVVVFFYPKAPVLNVGSFQGVHYLQNNTKMLFAFSHSHAFMSVQWSFFRNYMMRVTQQHTEFKSKYENSVVSC